MVLPRPALVRTVTCASLSVGPRHQRYPPAPPPLHQIPAPLPKAWRGLRCPPAGRHHNDVVVSLAWRPPPSPPPPSASAARATGFPWLFVLGGAAACHAARRARELYAHSKGEYAREGVREGSAGDAGASCTNTRFRAVVVSCGGHQVAGDVGGGGRCIPSSRQTLRPSTTRGAGAHRASRPGGGGRPAVHRQLLSTAHTEQGHSAEGHSVEALALGSQRSLLNP